VTDQFNHWYYY